MENGAEPQAAALGPSAGAGAGAGDAPEAAASDEGEHSPGPPEAATATGAEPGTLAGWAVRVLREPSPHAKRALTERAGEDPACSLSFPVCVDARATPRCSPPSRRSSAPASHGGAAPGGDLGALAVGGLAVEHLDRGVILIHEVTNAESCPPFGAKTSATSPCRGTHRVLSH